MDSWEDFVTFTPIVVSYFFTSALGSEILGLSALEHLLSYGSY